ncbi:unnamed protein product [Allacma fusca]|uniref:Uncharacterized protein n=1 Tax=Allacma fusca TaxID=39272 RepID=A0A8J2KD29_9HEXA|nr:unnamed protein product [Allacma fusca]
MIFSPLVIFYCGTLKSFALFPKTIKGGKDFEGLLAASYSFNTLDPYKDHLEEYIDMHLKYFPETNTVKQMHKKLLRRLVSFSDKNNYVNATRLFQEPKTATVYESTFMRHVISENILPEYYGKQFYLLDEEFTKCPYGWKLALTNADVVVETFNRFVSTGIFSHLYQLFLKTERRYVRLWWDTRLQNTTATGFLKKENRHVPGARINLGDSNVKAILICYKFGISVATILALLEIMAVYVSKKLYS